MYCSGALRSEWSPEGVNERSTERPEPHEAAQGASPLQYITAIGQPGVVCIAGIDVSWRGEVKFLVDNR